jgi:hypothetical protein
MIAAYGSQITKLANAILAAPGMKMDQTAINEWRNRHFLRLDVNLANTRASTPASRQRSLLKASPSHPLPALRLVATQRGQMVLHLRTRVEHLRHGRGVPRLPPALDFDPMPPAWRMVAAL